MKSACICLSHEIDKKGKISKDFQARLDSSYEIFIKNKCNYMLLTGGKNKFINSGNICDIALNYLISNYSFEKKRAIHIKEAKDTIGEAIFSKKKIDELKLKNIFIVTSDWHIQRAKSTFNKIYCEQYLLNWIGITGEKKYFEAEKQNNSLKLFSSWYKKRYSFDNELLIEKLKNNHKYYIS